MRRYDIIINYNGIDGVVNKRAKNISIYNMVDTILGELPHENQHLSIRIDSKSESGEIVLLNDNFEEEENIKITRYKGEKSVTL